MTLRDGLQCRSCKSVVTGYEHRMKFTFIDGERIYDGDYAVLSCECEILEYDVIIEDQERPEQLKLVDTLRKVTVLEFLDDGPHNIAWGQSGGC